MNALAAYIRLIDRFNRRVGRFAMYLIFAMMGVLLWSSISKYAGSPALWTLEMAQFIMVGYYVLGGPYSVQMGDHVRMDLFYSRFSRRGQATLDAITLLAVIFFLIVLLWGGISSTQYAIQYGQKNYSAWSPVLWPVKVAMSIGVFLMLLQVIAQLFRDIAQAMNRPIS